MKTLNVILFFNNLRGLSTLKFLLKKKDICIEKIYLAKKNLNQDIIKILKKDKIAFKIINKQDLINIGNIVKGKNIDLNLICGFPYILKKNLFNASKYGTLNLHAGSLPKYRGGSPLNWQIINGEKKIGISVIKINNKIDSGPVIAEKFFDLKNNYDIKKVHDICNKMFPKLLYKSIKKIIKQKKTFLKKDKKKKMYFKQRKEKDGQIDWNNFDSTKVFNFVRALTKPYPGAFSFDKNKKKILIYKCKKVNLVKRSYVPGQVFKKKNKIYIKTKKNFVRLISFKGKLKKNELLTSG